METEFGRRKKSSFSSPRAYAAALLETPRRLMKRMPAVMSREEEMNEVKARSGADMQRSLRWYDLIAFGIGGMVGAGVFVTTGQAARDYAGPAVIISYAIAGVSALLSAFCYTEFAVAIPVAGGSFSYLRTTFGEFAAYIVGANLLMEYVFSNAAVARSFTSYVEAAFGLSDDNAWRFHAHALPPNFNQIDLLAVAVVLIITAIICYSTKESSWVNMVITVIHLLVLVFIIVMGFVLGDVRNLSTPELATSRSGFAPYGAKGVFNGAALVYFSYIGYDAVSTMAEEVKNHAKDIPVGVSGSVAIVSLIYCLLATSLVWMVPYDAIDKGAPFPRAFNRVGMHWEWVSNVVGAVAAMGILTSLMVAMIGQSRYMCVIGRTHVVPHWFAKVNPKTGTPLNATVALGICTAVIALFTDLAVLVNLISIGTLFVFYTVACALIYRRFVLPDKTRAWPTLSYIGGLSVVSMVFACYWQSSVEGRSWGLGASGAVAVLMTLGFWLIVPEARPSEEWGVPFMPWTPAASVFLNIFLLGSLDRDSYIRFAVFSGIAIAFYVLYSVHATYDAESEDAQVASSENYVHTIEMQSPIKYSMLLGDWGSHA